MHVFHRGMALNAMWEDCYFMPSERSEEDARINGYIISDAGNDSIT